MNFTDFIRSYNDGTIENDAAWRAYDIGHMANNARTKAGLRNLGFLDTSYNGYAALARMYKLDSPERARYLVGLWWTWRLIANGDIRRGIFRRQAK